MGTISLRLSKSLHERLRELTKRENVSMNQFITLALAEKIAALSTEDDLLERAERGNRTSFERAMDKVADVEPPHHEPWLSLYDSLEMFSDDFMEDREQPSQQDREFLLEQSP
jgi:hypothetical protein